MEKPPLGGLMFSFTVWKRCTIQGSSISEQPHCLKWQSAQSCAAISLLSTPTLPDLMWPTSRFQDHPAGVMTPTCSCPFFSYLVLVQFLHHRKLEHFCQYRLSVLFYKDVRYKNSKKQCREGKSLLPVILCACWTLHDSYSNLHCDTFLTGFCIVLKFTWNPPWLSCWTPRWSGACFAVQLHAMSVDWLVVYLTNAIWWLMFFLVLLDDAECSRELIAPVERKEQLCLPCIPLGGLRVTVSIILDTSNTTEYSEVYNPDVVTYLALLVLGKNQTDGLCQFSVPFVFLSDSLNWLVVGVESAAMWLIFLAHITQTMKCICKNALSSWYLTYNTWHNSIRVA